MLKRILSTLMGVSLLGAVLLESQTVLAQQPGGFLIEEIIVTARRQEENLQEVPIAVTSLSSETLERRQLFSTADLDQAVPNLQFNNNATLAGNNSSSQIFIRGIGQLDPTSTVDPGVGIYIDDVYMGQSLGGTMDFRDIANVQVLRGPQGTLFGRNTIGGAILLTTRDPGQEFSSDLKVKAGSDSLYELFGAVDLPISNTVTSRLTFGRKVQDGYVTRSDGEDLGDTNTLTATGKLLITPSEDLQIKLLFDYTDSDENGNPLVFAANNRNATFQIVASQDAGCPGTVFAGPASVPPPADLDDPRCANAFQNAGEFRNNGTFPLTSELENWGVGANIEYDINDTLTFKSITSARSLDWVGIRDADNTPLTILHTSYDSDGEQWSQEFQLLYNADSLTGVVGAYYFAEEVDDIVTVQLNTPAPGTQQDSDNNKTDNSSVAVFTQWTFTFNDQWDLTLGGRYTEDTKASTPDQFNFASPNDKYLPVQKYEDTFDAFTGTLSLAYRINSDAMIYGSYSEGFKGGGWNSHFNTCQVPDSVSICFSNLPPATATPDRANSLAAQAIFPQVHKFDEEKAQTIELGFKLDLLNNTMRLNGAIFDTDYDDLQFIYRAGVAPYLTNAGKASIKGAELELSWVPNENWLVDFGLGYLDDSIDQLDVIAGIATGVEVGNTLPYTPDLQANIGLGFIGHIGNLRISPRVDIAYQDETFFDANNTVEIAQLDTVTVVNASLLIEPDSSYWRVALGINNATDEIYPIAGNSSLTTGSGYAEIAYARPREAFASLSFEF